jgi:hypothetical protein
MQTALYTLAGITFGTFAWEHAGRLNHWAYRPSIGLGHVATFAINRFTDLGRIIARLSSFLTYLHLEEMFETIGAVVTPAWKLIISPFYTITGYFSQIKFYNHPYLVVVGSMSLVAAVAFPFRHKIFALITALRR